jgi:hypothetical protein
MTDDRGERRSETAKRHDDSDIIEDASENPSPDKVGREGGNLARDVGTAAAERKVRDPEARENMTKEQEVDHGGSSTAVGDKGAT